MQITVKPTTGTTAGKKYPTIFTMIRTEDVETWTGNTCQITRSKIIEYAKIKDDVSADKTIDGKDIMTVEKE